MRRALEIITLVAAYFLAAKIGLWYAPASREIAAVLPASGVGLVGLLYLGRRAWPAILLAAFAAYATTHAWPVAGSLALASTLEVLVAVTVVRRLRLDTRLGRLQDALGLSLAALAGATLSGAWVLLTLGLAERFAQRELLEYTLNWWLAKMVGYLVVAPALLTLGSWRDFPPAKRVEAGVILGLVIGLGLLLLTRAGDLWAQQFSIEYLLFPFLVWSAVRLGTAGSASTVLAAAVILTLGISELPVPVTSRFAERELFLLQINLGIFAATGLLLAAVTAERRQDRSVLESESSYRQALEAATPTGLVGFDAEGRQTYVNETFCRMLGCRPEDLLGKRPPFVYWPDEYLEPNRTAFQQMLRGEVAEGGWTLRYRRTNGECFDVQLSASRVEAQDRSWLVSITDVSEQRRSAEERQRLLEQEQAARAASEAAQKRLTLLVESSAILASSLDYPTTLNNVAQLVVPEFADWCMVDLVREDGAIDRVALAHRDPEQLRLVQELRERYPLHPDQRHGAYHVIQTGSAELYPEVHDSLLAEVAQDAEHLEALRQLGIRSALVVPLQASGRVLGAITWVSSSDRFYNERDLAFAETLARRCAGAIEHAQLYQEAQQAVAQRELAIQQHRQMEEKLELLVRASTTLVNALDSETVLSSILSLAREIVAADAHAVWRLEQPAGTWRMISSCGLSDSYPRLVQSSEAMLSLIQTPLVVTDLEHSESLRYREQIYRSEGIRSLLVMPLWIRGEVGGTLAFYLRQPHEFTSEEIRIATALANLAASAIGVWEMYAEQQQLRLESQQAEQRYLDLVNSLDAIVWEADARTWQFQFVSQRAEELLGYPVQRWLSDPNFWLSLIHEDYREQTVAYCQAATERGEPHDFEYPAVAADGRVVWLRDIVQITRDERGQVAQLRGVMVDVTARRGAEEAQRRSEERLRALNATLEERVSRRTAQLADRAGQLRRLTTELTRTEERERRRLAQLLHDHLQQLLVAAQMQLEALRIAPPGEFREATDRVDSLIQQSIEASRSLTMELSPPILYDANLTTAFEWLKRQMLQKYSLTVELQADPKAEPRSEDLRVFLFRAAQELLFNAVKHARVDRVRLTLQSSNEQHTVLTVEDHGRGFDAKSLLRPKSDGFGLFSIRERVEYLGGHLQITSRPGRGARFEVHVPRELASPAKSAGHRESQHDALAVHGITSSSAELQAAERVRVLIVDDHRIVRAGLIGLLRTQTDIEVVGEAADGEQAVELVRQLHPDVVAMDVTMPRMNGLEATRLITHEFPHTRVIGLSMHPEEDMAQAMLDAGAFAYVAKDGRADALLSAIRLGKMAHAPDASPLAPFLRRDQDVQA